MVVTDAPSTVARNTGSRLWTSSEEVSMNSEVKPSAHTPPGRRERPSLMSSLRFIT
jgi:hypothetical protein